MYRDEEEALRARLQTVEAELEAEKRKRESAEADARLAEARVMELSIKREPAEAMTARRRRLLLFTVRLGAAVLGYIFSSSFIFTGRKQERARTVMSARAVEELRAVNKELKASLDKQRAVANELNIRLRRTGEDLRVKNAQLITNPLTGQADTTLMVMGRSRQARLLLGQARQAYTNGEYKQVQSMARTLLSMDAKDQMAWQLIGAAACQQGDLDTKQEALGNLKAPYDEVLVRACMDTSQLPEAAGP